MKCRKCKKTAKCFDINFDPDIETPKQWCKKCIDKWKYELLVRMFLDETSN
ncbi:MAG: hypothetical protein V1759_00045 [bacterium]